MSDEKKSADHDLGSKAFAGAAIMIGTRFFVRLLGLISVTLLARLLTPEDFGLFGTAALVLAFFILLKEVGFGEAVVKAANLSRSDIDTLWTMRLILSLLTGSAVFLVAGPAALFLKDARVEAVLHLMALIPIIDAFASPATPLLLREFKYKTDFILKSGNKIVQVTAVVVMALILQSYWALVYGSLLSSLFAVGSSHIIRPYRPHLTLKNLTEHVNFAAWSYLRSVSLYIANASDEYIVRSASSTAFFGIYHIARDLARVLIGDMIGPLREAMLPALSKMQGNSRRHAEAVTNIFGAALIIGTVLTCGIIITAPELVLVLLGDQWVAAGKYLSILAVGGACNAIAEVNQSGFITAGLQKKAAIFWTGRALIYGASCLAAGLISGPLAIAYTFSGASALFLMIEIWYLLHILGEKTEIFVSSLRPLIAGVAMAFAVTMIPIPTLWPTIIILAVKAALGGIIFGLLLLGLWRLSGYREGPEYTLFTKLPAKFQKILPVKIKNEHSPNSP